MKTTCETFSVLFDLVQLHLEIYTMLNLGGTISRALSGFKSIWSMISASDSSVLRDGTFQSPLGFRVPRVV